MRPQVIKEEVLCQGEYQALTLLTYRDARGRVRTWECSRRRARGAVLMVAITPEGDLLLARQFRPPFDDSVVEFPAGLIDRDGESPEQVAARELEEETGYRPGRLELLAEGPVSPGLGSEYIWVYLAANLAEGRTRPEEGEEIELLRVPLAGLDAQIAEWSRQRQLIDPKIPGFARLAQEALAGRGAGG